MSADPFASWRQALAGGKPGIHDGEPWCGYFRMRDRRGVYAGMAPIKRPWIGCAIWINDAGEMVAERAKQPVPVDALWPYAARYPIPYEAYAFWHAHERWPEEADFA